MEFLYFLPVFLVLVFAYGCGIGTVYLFQWLERRSLARTQEQAGSEHEEVDYTLTVVKSPRNNEGA